MNIPIEDAVTVAYVDIVHALSELREISPYDHGALIESELDEAVEDLTRALEMLKPHVREGDAQTRPTDDPNVVVVWGDGQPYVRHPESKKIWEQQLEDGAATVRRIIDGE